MQIGEIRSHESMHKPESEKSSQVQRMPKQLDTPALKALMKRGGVASSDEMQGDLHSYVVTMFPDSQLAENVPINFAL